MPCGPARSICLRDGWAGLAEWGVVWARGESGERARGPDLGEEAVNERCLQRMLLRAEACLARSWWAPLLGWVWWWPPG